MWVNGGTYVVHVTDPYGDSAWAERPNPKNNYNRKFKSGYVCVIYPFSAIVDWNDYTARKIFTVNVPREYKYKESGRASGSKQILDGLPMVAYRGNLTNNNVDALYFKHLTAALTVRVTNKNLDGYIEVEKIVVINNKYQLCGNVQVTLGDSDPVIKTEGGSYAIPYEKNSPDSVTLNFPNGYQISDYHDFQIPILPVGSGNSQFTIKVYGKSYTSTSSGWVIRKYGPYKKSTNESNKAIGRACLGYAPLSLKREDSKELFAKIDTTITLSDGRSSVTGDFYKIYSNEDLKELSDVLDERENPLRGSEDAPLFHNSNYIVMDNINMGGDTIVPLHYYNEGGTERCYFYGNGKTVSNVVISSVNENDPHCCGFFGRTAGDDITIDNLTIDSASYEIAHTKEKIIGYDANYCSAVGGIYACVDHNGIVIQGCHVRNVTMGSVGKAQGSTDYYSGGIVGVVFTSVTIRNCSVGTVTVDNSHDSSSSRPLVVDQFGAAVARIDVGDGSGSNTYGTIVHPNRTPIGDTARVPAVIIENFSYDQGGTELKFVAGLRNVRYGGLVGNITRGGRLIMRNCSVNHKVKILGKPSEALFVSGLIGCAKITQIMGLHLRANCSVTGTIVNNAPEFTDYTSDQFVISKYCSVIERSNSIDYYKTLKDNKYIAKIDDLSYPCAITCNNTLSVSGNTNGFRVNDQTF